MNLNFLKGVLLFAILLLAQVLVLNHIHLFDCATPLLYVYVVLLFRRNYPRWGILLVSFLLGLVVDIFSNTPGVAAASMTFLGFLQPYVFAMFLNRDSDEDLQPSMKSLGFAKFFYYAAVLVVVYCAIFFTIETFSFFNGLLWLECVGGSAMLTILLILAIENSRKR
ncbi:MAG: rod shape-determining protein MreD [Prevotella sp.]